MDSIARVEAGRHNDAWEEVTEVCLEVKTLRSPELYVNVQEVLTG